MTPWRTEIRSRSAYISGGQLRAHRHDDSDMHTGFAIPIRQAGGLLAALDQIIDHPGLEHISETARNWSDNSGHWTEWTVDDGWLYLSGPCYVYGAAGTGWVPATNSMFEIDYSTIVAALNLLYAALASVSDHG
jgi:hypothetical protein